MKKIFSFLIIFITIVVLTSSYVNAKQGDAGSTASSNSDLCDKTSGKCLENPLGETKDIPTLIGKVINAVLGLVGSIALLMFIYGGIVWMTSQGNEQKVQKGKDILIWATLGLIVIFTSYALTSFIIGSIAGK